LPCKVRITRTQEGRASPDVGRYTAALNPAPRALFRGIRGICKSELFVSNNVSEVPHPSRLGRSSLVAFFAAERALCAKPTSSLTTVSEDGAPYIFELHKKFPV
jgi:hypothetical protein